MDPMQFLDILDTSLSEAELGTLCRQFNVAYGAFPGSTKREKAREFLGYIRRMGRMTSLAEATVALRPDLAPAIAQLYEGKDENLAWLDQIVAGEGRVMDSGLTWRWSSSSSAARVTPTPPPSKTSDVTGAIASLSDTPNPYTPGAMVTQENMFFGRALERDQLWRQFNDGDNVAIVSGRDFGGSSLLYHMANRFSESSRQLTAYVDMKDALHQTLSGLLNSAWKQWWERVKPGNVATIRNLSDFRVAVRKLNAAGFRPLLFLDEWEQLVWRPAIFDDGLFDAWSELGRSGQMGFMITCHASPAELLVQSGYNSQFYELFQQLNLGLLETSAARDMLALPPQRLGLEVPDGAVDYFLSKAGPHPFFLQLAGHYLFDSLSRKSYSRTDVNTLFTTAAEPFWQELWDSLTPLAQANYPTDPTTMVDGMAGRQLRILANRGLVVADDKGFHPFSAGFVGWLGRIRAATEAASAAMAAVSPV